MEIFISILDCDILKINEIFNELKNNGIKNIHLDIIDTSFVDTISFGLNTINKILDFDFIFDLHFMINKPELIIKKINIKRVRKVYVHLNCNIEGLYTILGNKLGIAVNPNEDVEFLNSNENFNKKVYKFIDSILLMSVYPGYGNQKYISVNEKIKKCKLNNKEVGVDGGINISTISDVKEADFIVIGSGYFKYPNKTEFLNDIKKVLK